MPSSRGYAARRLPLPSAGRVPSAARFPAPLYMHPFRPCFIMATHAPTLKHHASSSREHSPGRSIKGR